MSRYYKILSEQKVKLVYIPLAVYWIVLLIMTSIPSKSLPTIGVNDKFEHLFAYLILGVLIYSTFEFQNKVEMLRKYSFSAALIVLSFYGLIDELHQIFIPGRYCETLDLLADIFGGSIGVTITYFTIFKEKHDHGEKS